MITLLKEYPLILMEGAIVERVRHESKEALHPRLVNALLIYTETGRKLMESLYREYLDIAREAALPMILCSPTWRANRERVSAGRAPEQISGDNIRFLKELAAQYPQVPVRIGGMLGCRNDCYKAHEALTAEEAEDFHIWQIEELSRGGADFLIAETLPAVSEALGLGRAMRRSTLPYILSFTIDRAGRVLDGTLLSEAIRYLDTQLDGAPLGYMVNCAYPTFLNIAAQDKRALQRLIGFQANASDLDQCDLDGSCELHANPVDAWGEAMRIIHRKAGVPILGGCCGTNGAHIRYLAKILK